MENPAPFIPRFLTALRAGVRSTPGKTLDVALLPPIMQSLLRLELDDYSNAPTYHFDIRLGATRIVRRGSEPHRYRVEEARDEVIRWIARKVFEDVSEELDAALKDLRANEGVSRLEAIIAGLRGVQ
jgi:hypothetical protein